MSLSKDIHIDFEQTHALDDLSPDEVARLLLEKIVRRPINSPPSPHSDQYAKQD